MNILRNERIKSLGGFGIRRTKIKPSALIYNRKKKHVD